MGPEVLFGGPVLLGDRCSWDRCFLGAFRLGDQCVGGASTPLRAQHVTIHGSQTVDRALHA